MPTAGPRLARGTVLSLQGEAHNRQSRQTVKVGSCLRFASVPRPFMAAFAMSPHEPKPRSALTECVHFSIAERGSSGFDNSRIVPSFFSTRAPSSGWLGAPDEWG